MTMLCFRIIDLKSTFVSFVQLQIGDIFNEKYTFNNELAERPSIDEVKNNRRNNFPKIK